MRQDEATKTSIIDDLEALHEHCLISYQASLDLAPVTGTLP